MRVSVLLAGLSGSVVLAAPLSNAASADGLPGNLFPQTIATPSTSGPGLSVYVTNANSSFLLAANGGGSYVVSGAFTGDCNSDAAGGCWQLAVDDTASGHQQTITGFGGAITDTAVSVYNSLNVAQKAQFMIDFFTPAGLNFNLMRHTIGSSDLTPPNTNYTYDDTAGDAQLSQFSLGKSGGDMLGFILAMKATNPLVKLVGASWSAPAWMKQNRAQQGWTGGDNYLNGYYTNAFANYFVKYLQAFARSGVVVDYLSVQNEPLNSNPNYPTMYVGANDMANFTPLMARRLTENNLSTKLMVYDHNTDQPGYPQAVLDAAAPAHASQLAVGWHCYATDTDWRTISAFAAANPGIEHFMTECWTSPTVPYSNVADFSLGPLQNQASGVMTWTVATDGRDGPAMPGSCTTCRGLVVVDTAAGTYTHSLDYYMMGQFSKFIHRGAVALTTTGSYDYGHNAKFQAQAFLNPDGSKVVVIENTFAGDHLHLTVTLKGGAVYSGKVLGEAVTTWVIAKGY
ncbi:putative Beta-1,6-glucanase [Taphrina deformans PYCC 5710]|uniref:Beta-1,6-glucanase n=1 Tax=Taphrina deformans (strain PYCC 5710 / ATCC 11124 / CBS 356.35 / IMI 108563 / JCM 9778 / NBRC 8474) TaxID=1097556 RepID=R4X9K5_TAPDE|nr:putative Beta-1,6-glucanase [Taphrina deformans PYCC 5710]|eukprot:CCG80914.1 putative Beta-1,6-glucanase [Taphrina deformans PYCC 5710]